MTFSLATIISEISSAQGRRFEVLAGPVKGGSNIVYEIQAEDGTCLCLRIPLDADAAHFGTKGTSILYELKTTMPALRVPAVIYQSEQYTLMDYLHGDVLKFWNTKSLTSERRRVLLDDLAALLFSLWTIDAPAFQRAGHDLTYREWLRNEVDKGLRRTLQGTSAWGDPIHYLYRRIKIDDVVPSPDDRAIAIKHGDLNAWNVITNENGLSGVVDWDTSRVVPAPSAVQHPLFIANIPGWQNDDVPEDMKFDEDRAYLENAIGKLDANSTSSGRIERLLRTSFERQFLEMSLHNRRINDEYIEQRFENTESSRRAALRQLEDFLSANESLRALPAVSDVRRKLSQCRPIA